MDRANFIKISSAALTGAFAFPPLAAVKSSVRPVCVFSKCLQFLDYARLGEVIAKLGFDGADLTVRKDGHVSPSDVKVNLPRAVKAIRSSGVDVPMIVTGINEADSGDTENTLAVAAELGIKYYRLGYFYYDKKQTVYENLDRVKRELEKIASLNRKYQIQGGYQNHSGAARWIGGPVWDLHYLVKDFDPAYLGIQYDIMHATVEGGYTWTIPLQVIYPWITSLAVKDFRWEKREGKWRTTIMPLGEGMVNFEKYLNEMGLKQKSLPVTIHYEYDLGGAEHGSRNPDMGHEVIYHKMMKDLAFVRNHF